jgi:hypothetical protein
MSEVEQLVTTIAQTVTAELWKKMQTGGVPVLPEYVTTKQASILLSIPERTLEDYRNRKSGGPPYSLVGVRVRYRLADLRAWAEAGRVVPGGAR